MKGRKTGGRHKGTPNKATADVKAIAQVYTAEAVARLAFWMRSENAQASVAACHGLLDRGHGKAPQAVTGADGSPLIPAKVIHEHLTA